MSVDTGRQSSPVNVKVVTISVVGLLAAVTPDAQRSSADPPLPCAMSVYLRTGPDSYMPYTLLGGP